MKNSLRRSVLLVSLGGLAAAISLCAAPLRAESGGDDIVYLVNGSQKQGRVIELGGNSIELLMQAGSRRILKREIESVRFDETRTATRTAETDMVIRKDGHRIQGKVTVLRGGKSVRVTLPGGSTADIPRSTVLKIIHAGEVIEEGAAFYTAALAARVDRAVQTVLDGKGGKAVEEAEKFLIENGIFAIYKVRAALKKLADAAGGASKAEHAAARKVLRRVDRAYRLREVMRTAIEQIDEKVYDVLCGTDVHAKCNLLLLVFPRLVEESIYLARFLAGDDLQEPVVRAWSIDFLRRMQRNKDLLDVYRESEGREQLAAAIALGRNGILLGIPALLEAMSFQDPQVRTLAATHLKNFTGEDLGFRADAAPAARRAALEKWTAWWEQNDGRITEVSRKILNKDEVKSGERTAAEKLWKDASKDMGEGRYTAAEEKLRSACRVDVSFHRATICLAVLLYTRQGKPCEAAKLLQTVKAQPSINESEESREWLYLHLGNSLRLCGDVQAALEAYRQCSISNPDNLQAAFGAGETAYQVSTSQANLDPKERRKGLEVALSSFGEAVRIIDKQTGSLSLLRSDQLPVPLEMSFDRRRYNRTVLELRDTYRLQKQQAIFQTAKIRSLLGQDREALKSLGIAAKDLDVLETKAAKELRISIGNYTGMLYEKMKRPLLAFREYRNVLDKLDPENAEAKAGVERLRRKLRAEK